MRINNVLYISFLYGAVLSRFWNYARNYLQLKHLEELSHKKELRRIGCCVNPKYLKHTDKKILTIEKSKLDIDHFDNYHDIIDTDIYTSDEDIDDFIKILFQCFDQIIDIMNDHMTNGSLNDANNELYNLKFMSTVYSKLKLIDVQQSCIFGIANSINPNKLVNTGQGISDTRSHNNCLNDYVEFMSSIDCISKCRYLKTAYNDPKVYKRTLLNISNRDEIGNYISYNIDFLQTQIERLNTEKYIANRKCVVELVNKIFIKTKLSLMNKYRCLTEKLFIHAERTFEMLIELFNEQTKSVHTDYLHRYLEILIDINTSILKNLN